MCVNGKCTDIIPCMKVNGVKMAEKETVTYLGDQFNSNGNNQELIKNRVHKGETCMINAMSLCSDVTMGTYTIQTLLLLYRSLFLPVVLFNAEAWSNLTKQEIVLLTTTQLKYAKRALHAPSSTSNPATFLELGILPIEYEIHIRQLTFLHHVLNLTVDDPVKLTYNEQIKYECEQNWGNEINELRVKYDITEEDEQIAKTQKQKWKNKIKTKVKSYAIERLNNEIKNQKKAALLTPYTEFKAQDYLQEFPPYEARKIFHIRTGTLDIKTLRKYKYGSDILCRLCGKEDENVIHIVNSCCNISRTFSIENIYSTGGRKT